MIQFFNQSRIISINRCFVFRMMKIVTENIPFSTKALLVLLMSTFFAKNQPFWPKKYLYSKQWCESCVREFFSSVFSFCKRKGSIDENISFTDYASGNRLPDCSKLRGLKSGNWKYPHLCFAQCLQNGASQENQILHERLK